MSPSATQARWLCCCRDSDQPPVLQDNGYWKVNGTGYMDGAIRSGQRVAAEIIAAR
ncbi:hypothetical protein ACQP2U_19200 [Nocardia sp. CA-084685]|uniref:hypothetical protein n=1 Tax=Nocardia sp. CA-084685 TaxID=3239970 RepID=UPI003D985375